MLPDWDWQLLEMPPRHFSWRMRGNPLHFGVTEAELLRGDYDLVCATSMVDLATLRGLVPALAQKPAVLYFHENQFAYPQSGAGHSLLEAQMVSLYSALAADQLLFNSRYNRDSFVAGVDALLGRLPDFVPEGLAAALRDKAEVLPVPLAAAPEPVRPAFWAHRDGRAPGDTLRIVWAARMDSR